MDLKGADWKPQVLVDNFDDQWGLIGNVGTQFFLMTDKDAPRFRVVSMRIDKDSDKDSAAAKPNTTDVLPEQAAVMNGGSLVGGRLLSGQSKA